MTNYNESVDRIDTPLLNHREVYQSQYSHDPVRQVQLRMVLIMGISLLVAATLALLALPATAGTDSGIQQSVSEQIVEPIAASEVQLSAPLSVGIGQAGVAEFFTPEVKYWESEIISWADEYNVDPNAVATIMQIESCGDPQAVSTAGARGLFQVMPFHFGAGEDMLDPDTNARRGMNFLNEQLRYTGGDLYLSFAGYNGGYAASGGNYDGWPDETKRYFRWAKGIYEDASAGAASSATLNEWLDAGGRPGCQRAAERLGI